MRAVEKKSRPLPKRYPLKESCLYKVPSRSKLSQLLLADLKFLQFQTTCDTPYLEFKVDGRKIQEPKPGLKKAQLRFATLLSAVITPDYLHSGVKRRSYVSNSEGHDAGYACAKLDVKKFYPSATAEAVSRFFTEKLEWPADVAAFGTKLLTWRGHLPTGGNASPILSFWAYRPMFDEISDLAKLNNCHFSLYVDDMTLTGRFATRRLQYRACQIVRKHGLIPHKLYTFSPRQARVITGVARTVHGSQLPRARQKLVWEAHLNLKRASNGQEKAAAFKTLVGRVCEAAHVDPYNWSDRAENLLKDYRKFVKRDRYVPRTTMPLTPVPDFISSALPWAHEDSRAA